MKLTKSKLKEVIREVLEESKEEHIKGIADKIDRLRKASDDARKGLENDESAARGDDMILMDIRSQNYYFAKQREISNLENKITLLVKQLNQLKQDEPGQLERPME